ncbi:hypothetical protein mRhiFer1_008493 [Rhinolophus ferrumequinum]|uniref:Uncharacterized protein n=1 Tax=Rhinolophus ferrumequinum TaxID=59479 RepID=A0A7J7UX31_RHIFE|nr:hypothetical protein mRhiFer1_008493 [Rhinolophus ferrumequinum]
MRPVVPLARRLPDAGGNRFSAHRPLKFPCLSPRSVTGYPLPQQHDPIINKSFLDPPLPRAPSGTLAAAAAADPFQKGGVATAGVRQGAFWGSTGAGPDRCHRAGENVANVRLEPIGRGGPHSRVWIGLWR